MLPYAVIQPVPALSLFPVPRQARIALSLAAVLFCLATGALSAQVRLPKLIGNGMVLQRDSKVTIWGWATPGEKVTVHFLNTTYTAHAGDAGQWHMMLTEMTAGGPYTMTIEAANSIVIDDIMIGDVWICSGQSNMELPIRRVAWKYTSELRNIHYPAIRQFIVPKEYDFNTLREDLSGGSWKAATPDNLPEFSAAAYFFAEDLYQTYGIPIGLILTALGGSPAEAWMSEQALKAFPEQLEEALRFRDDALIEKTEHEDRERSEVWYAELHRRDQGYQDPAGTWYSPSTDATGWETYIVPGYWSSAAMGPVNGALWFKKQVVVPASMADKPAMLILGCIVDADSAFINGRFVGNITYQYPPRRYEVPAGVLKEGSNTIDVRVVNTSGRGGFVPDKLYALVADKDTLDLSGEWKYRLGAEMPPLPGQTFIRWKPMGLYNAMIHPLKNYAIKGVIWYQGEANASRKPWEYYDVFSTMIRDWRKLWGQGDFPFLYVQLASFMEARELPSESNWALLREKQLNTLSVPRTGMAVTIDIGEWNDIHPLNKKDVGLRLALAAKKIAYSDKRIVHSGPVYTSMKIRKNKIVLSFAHTGSGLVVKGGNPLRQFAIAGADKKYVWANAQIKGKKIVVWHDDIPRPVAVRYAWADNPAGANLYNKEGLPTSPFRTDDW